MYIIPALYLSRGVCVSHYKGEREQSTVLSRDPLHEARNFEKQGAKVIHLVDLDATDGGSSENRKIATVIARHTTLAIQFAEGIDSLEAIAELIKDGIDYVGLNQLSETLIEQALARFGPEKIFFTIRAQRHEVENKPGIEIVDYGAYIAGKGFSHLIFRDTKSEGTFHPNFDEVDRLILGTAAHIIPFGGIGSMSDLTLMQKTGASAVIISRAFFEGRLNLRECIEKFRHIT